ncbi:MAG: peptidoglycan-binding protein [Oscillospiraceae bacterium]
MPPIVPETITVHLGAPNQPARNVVVPLADYIKNVASSEIYPTWPESAIRANILAQISFALNRVYTEHYRSQGFDFDITNNTQYDQKFIEDRDFFDNIVKIVDDIFNDYVVKQGTVQPYFTLYCSGTTVTCEGLSQWGTVTLAEQGLVPYEILQHYYGDDINIVFNAPVGGNIPSYPGIPLRLGSAGEEVRTIQQQLNRISQNYPAIPLITEVDGIFGLPTDTSVRKFQGIFNLTVDGIVGKATWYKIKQIYNGVKRLSDLYSEGISIEEAQPLFTQTMALGSTGNEVRVIQYYLNVIAYFDEDIPAVTPDGIYDDNTQAAVLAFQQQYGLEPTGNVNRDTWNKILQVYDQTINSLPPEVLDHSSEIYPGRVLSLGMTGPDVEALQRFLERISSIDSDVPRVTITGTFDEPTEAAVRLLQTWFNLPSNGVVGPLTWDRIVRLYKQNG